MAELADAGDSKSPEGNLLWVRFPLRAFFLFFVPRAAPLGAARKHATRYRSLAFGGSKIRSAASQTVRVKG